MARVINESLLYELRSELEHIERSIRFLSIRGTLWNNLYYRIKQFMYISFTQLLSPQIFIIRENVWNEIYSASKGKFYDDQQMYQNYENFK